MNIPQALFAGDSATWDDCSFLDALGGSIDSGSWTLTYVIGFPATAVTLTGVAHGAGWRTSISKTQTNVAAGDYFWQAYAETGSRRETLGSGRLTIKAVAAHDFAGKSDAEQKLEAIESAIDAIVTGGAVAEYTIGGRSLRKIPMSDLIVLRDRYKAIVSRENKARDIANGLGGSSNVFVRFK